MSKRLRNGTRVNVRTWWRAGDRDNTVEATVKGHDGRNGYYIEPDMRTVGPHDDPRWVDVTDIVYVERAQSGGKVQSQ